MAAAIIEAIVALEPEVQALIVALVRAIHKKKSPVAAAQKAHAAVDTEPDAVSTDLEN